MEALKFLDDKYDSKSGQVKFYPKTNKRLATQKNRNWKDIEGFDLVPDE